MRKRTRPKKLAVYALIILMAVFLHVSGWLRPVYDPLTGPLLKLAAPFYAAGSGVRQVFNGDPAASADPADLLRIIDDLRIRNAELQTLVAENEALKAALTFKELGQDLTVPARVVYESADDGARLLILDKGAGDGVRLGQPVITAGGVIAGKIFRTGARTSAMMPLTDSRSRLAVTVLNSPETLGVLAGDRGLSMGITLIPQNETISPGDPIVTSGLEPGIRRGLVVGTVENVNKSTQDPFQSANIAGFASAQHPLLVQVLIGGIDE